MIGRNFCLTNKGDSETEKPCHLMDLGGNLRLTKTRRSFEGSDE